MVLGCLCKACAFLTLVIAICVGLVVSGFVARSTPFFVFLDDYEFSVGKNFKGVVPAMHRDTPWGFTHEELETIDLTGQTIIVTGANVGLGLGAAIHLAKTNAKVVLGCRSMSKCKAAAEDIKRLTGKETYPMEINLASFESIRRFSAEFKKQYNSLDSLMLNAGVVAPPFTLTEEGLELQIGVNHFGHFLLTQEVIPLLENAAKERGVATVCVVSSGANFRYDPVGKFESIEEMTSDADYSMMGTYARSKLANVLFAKELAKRYKDKNILVNSIAPGMVKTEAGRHMFDSVSGIIGRANAEGLGEFIFSALWSPHDAALTQVYASIGPKLKKEKITGKYFVPIARLSEPNKQAHNETIQKSLWELTEAFIKAH